jgi:integrase
MQTPAFLSTLADRFSQYVDFRRLSGADPHSQTQLLAPFDRFLHQEGFQGPWPTREVIQRYAVTTQGLSPGSRENRFSVLRQFCRFLRQFEPGCYLPQEELCPGRRPVHLPHLYTKAEIRAMVAAARELEPRDSLRAKTYATLFGLLYTTGLRCGEAFALNLGHLTLDRNLLYVAQGKFGKARWVPISPSTSTVLQSYIHERARVAPTTAELPLFLTSTGRRVYHTNAEFAFRHVLTRCGLRGGKGCPGPRLHDLRHSFACTRLLQWYRRGRDVQALLPALATYLGHVKISSTQVYLHATAELLEQAEERFLKNFRENVLGKGAAS